MGGWRPWRPGRRAPLPGVLSDQYGFYFDPSRHDFSNQAFLGHSYDGGAGIAAGEQALDVLASAPATARHLSSQLAQYFVADDPPQTLVARMAERFEQTEGDIRAMLETLFFSPEFWDERYFGAKFKTPYEYVISAVRVTGAPDITNYRPLFGTMKLLGMAPYAHADARRLRKHSRGVAQPRRDDDAAQLRHRARPGPSAAARAAVRGGWRRRRGVSREVQKWRRRRSEDFRAEPDRK